MPDEGFLLLAAFVVVSLCLAEPESSFGKSARNVSIALIVIMIIAMIHDTDPSILDPETAVTVRLP